MNHNSLLTTEKESDDTEISRFEFPDSHSSPVNDRDKSDAFPVYPAKQSLFDDSSEQDPAVDAEHSDILVNSEVIPSEDDHELQESHKTTSNDIDFGDLMQQMVDKYPYMEEDSQHEEEVPIQPACDQQVETCPEEFPDISETLAESGNGSGPMPEVCEETPVAEMHKEDAARERFFEGMDSLDNENGVVCLDVNDQGDEKPGPVNDIVIEAGVIELPVINNGSAAITIDSPMHEESQKSAIESPHNGGPKHIMDINRNLNNSETFTVNTEITSETRITAVDGTVTEETTRTTLNEEKGGGDFIKSMFAGDQSVLAFFDTPKVVADDTEDKDQKAVTFI